MKLPSWLRLIWKWIGRNRIIVGVIAVVSVISGPLWWWNWEWTQFVWWWIWQWLGAVSEYRESKSTTLRNIGLLVGGGIAIWVAYRRSVISQRGLLNERYQKGAEMLGSDVLAVRLGGIYALQRLAEDVPEQYHVQIMHLFCAFVRHPTKDENYKPGPEILHVANVVDHNLKLVREDVQSAMRAICTRRYDKIKLEKKANFRLILTNADLPHAHLGNANLTGAILINANLTNADLLNAVLTSAYLALAKLTGVDMTNAVLKNAVLSGADMTKVKGLTQEQLNQARADPDNPPKLGGACDAETDLPLEWRGKPFSE